MAIVNATGELLTAWTIRWALLGYVTSLALQLTGGEHRQHLARWFWTLGCGGLIAHLASAFHYYHDWQHRRAVDETARRTAEMFGWEFGAGVYFNYLFAAVWVGDVLWWWLAPTSHERRPRWVTFAIHAYLLLIAVNGAMVFESGPTRWAGVLAIFLLVALATRRRSPKLTIFAVLLSSDLLP